MGKILSFPPRCGVCAKFVLCLIAKGVDIANTPREKIEEMKGNEGCAAFLGAAYMAPQDEGKSTPDAD